MEQVELKKLQGWPFWWIGAGLTLLYLLGLVIFLGRPLGKILSPDIDPNQVGDTLAGIFAPLAFIWLVVGIFQQGRELRIQVQDLKESVDAQKAMAKASGGQERLQNEQFLERLYRLYKSAAEDVLCQLLEQEHLTYTNVNSMNDSIIKATRIQLKRDQFMEGRRSEIVALARDIRVRLKDGTGIEHLFAKSLASAKHAQKVHSLAEDFVTIDDQRREALAKFKGGDVLQAVDDHEGFSDARALAEAMRGYIVSGA